MSAPRTDPSSTTATKPVKTVVMTPSTRTQGVRVDVDMVHLDDIPGAIENMGWKVSARLMRRWFATSPAWEMPQAWRTGYGIDYFRLPPSQIDDQIVKMDWALDFDRVRVVFEDLHQNWNSAAGIGELQAKLRNVGWDWGKTATLGRIGDSAKRLDFTCQVNRRLVGDTADTLDDFYGAIFKATMKLAVIGKASRSSFSKRDFFEIEKIGIYLRDTYDFNADPITDAYLGLGIWSKKRVLSKLETLAFRTTPMPYLAENFPGFVPIYNNDFRRWQQRHGTGGDFFVFSNVKWMEPHVEYVQL